MKIKTAATYSLPLRLIHWVMALIIITGYFVGDYLAELPKEADKSFPFGIHTSLGVLVALLVIVRIVIRLRDGAPDPIGSGPQLMIAKGLHVLFYALMIIIPFSGTLMVQSHGDAVSFFGLFDMPTLVGKNKDLHEFAEEFHEVMGTILMLAVIAHIGAAVYHHRILKDNTLTRMTKG